MDERGMAIAIGKKRKALAFELSNQMKHCVNYGPFKGMKFTHENWWGASDRAGMLLGIYEKEILDSIMNIEKIGIYLSI